MADYENKEKNLDEYKGNVIHKLEKRDKKYTPCLLYTSDAADD